jgi:hypothetical protein
VLSLCSLYNVRMGTRGSVTEGTWDMGVDCKRRKMGLWSEKVKSGSMRRVQESTMGTWVRVRMT